MKMTWILLGATSAIAQAFGHIAAENGHPLLLIGRNLEELNIIAADYQIRYGVHCDVIELDLNKEISLFLEILHNKKIEYALFIAYGEILENNKLSLKTIDSMLNTNITSTVKLIHTYLAAIQKEHRIIFLSSVAACRGRAKNSLYGGSKAAIEVYLQGLQQHLNKNQKITIAKLGFIDTNQTFGHPNIFYASPPKNCAKACWKASYSGSLYFYHPFFWRYIMGIIRCIPSFIFSRFRM